MHKTILNIILVFMLIIMSFSLYKVLSSKAQQEINIAKLKDVLNGDLAINSKLSSDYIYYKSNDYVEKVSRENLNMEKQGEFQVVLPTNTPTNSTYSANSTSEKKSRFSNLEAWFELLIN